MATGSLMLSVAAPAAARGAPAAAEATPHLAATATAAPPERLHPVEPAAPARSIALRATLEAGFLGVLSHRIQLGRDGTRIDYRDDAGQDILFPFWRASLDATLAGRHIVTLLYQPLAFDTREVLPRDVRIDGIDLAAGTPLRARYGFPFYRLAYAYDLLPARDRVLAIGLGLQIRNANIEFQSLDGSLLRRRSNVGPVPLLRARGQLPLGDDFFIGFEADGFYAPVSGLNLSDRDVLGAILDASIRVGWRAFSRADLFMSLRYIGGGARGEGEASPFDDGWQSNWLHFLVFSVGASFGG